MVPGVFQILVIAIIVLLLFGRGRIGDSLGELSKGVRSFRKGIGEGEQPESLPIEKVELAPQQSAADK